MKMIVSLTAAFMAFGFSTAEAAIPQAATDAFTAFTTDASAVVDLAWPIAAAVVVGLTFVKLFKKVISRAT